MRGDDFCTDCDVRLSLHDCDNQDDVTLSDCEHASMKADLMTSFWGFTR